MKGLNKLKTQLIFYFILLGLGFFVSVYCLRYPATNPMGHGVGPRILPQLSGGLLIILSVIKIIITVISIRKNSENEEFIHVPKENIIKIVLFFIITLLYPTLLLPNLGFVISTLGVSIIGFLIVGVDNKLIIGSVSLGITFFYWLLFINILNIPLPL